MEPEKPEVADGDEAESIFDAPKHGLQGRFAGGVIFNLSSQVIKLSVQLISLAAMSRLLTPASFGVVAMATPILLFGNLLQDLGLTQASVQQHRLSQRQASNMFWVSAGVGTIVTLLLAVTAPLLGAFYKDPRVSQILLASAPLALVTSLGLQHRALLMRRMQFNKLVMRDIAGVVVGMIVAISCAASWHSYWALYASNAATVFVTTGGAMIATRWIPSLPARDPEFKKMIHFGAGLSGYTLTNFLSRNLDSVLIGRYCGGAALGLYNRGYRILLFPLQQISWPIVQVMIPTLSKLVGEPDRYREAYMKVVRVILLITLPGILILAVDADWLVPLVLGSKWLGVIPIFRNLAIAGAVQPFNGPMNSLFITQGRTGQFARWGAFSAVLGAISFVIGLPGGPTGVALAYGLTEVFIRSPLYWWYATRQGPVRLIDLGRLGGPFALATAGVGVLAFGARMVWSPSSILGLAIYIPVTYGLFWGAIGLFPSGRKTFGAAWRLVQGYRQKLLGGWSPRATPASVGVKGGEG